MYKIINTLSFIVRQFCLPNPFMNIFIDKNIAEIANWIIGGVFIPLAYTLTGTWHVSKRDASFIGSIGFLINYILLTGILIGISYFITNIWIVFLLFAITYIILCVIEEKLFNSKNDFI